MVQERRTWWKHDEKWSKTAKPAVRSQKHTPEPHTSLISSAELHHVLPNWMVWRLRAFLRKIEALGSRSGRSSEAGKVDFGGSGSVVGLCGMISRVGREADFKKV